MFRLSKLTCSFSAAALAATLVAVPALRAQSARETPGARRATVLALISGSAMNDDPQLAAAVNGLLLSDTNAHMRMAPECEATDADRARAAEFVKTARAALGKYKDVKLAESDGYVKFLPRLEKQSIYHYISRENAIAEYTQIDPTHPSSLLYTKNKRGEMVLVGAMYGAPADMTPDELDARLPIGIAHWHEHVNFCGPQPSAIRDGTARVDGPTVAKWLSITSEQQCEAVGGRFVPRLFGWMAHVYLFAGNDPKTIWGEGHSSMHMH